MNIIFADCKQIYLKTVEMKYALITITVTYLLFFSSCKKRTEILYYPDGTIKEKYELKNGKYHGKYCSYYETGLVETNGQFREGVMDGEWRYYYSDGKIMTVQMLRKGNTVRFDSWDQNGNKVINDGTGTLTLYYPDGSKKSTNSYKNGHFDGANQSWYPNGIMESEQFFKEGKPIGIWHTWDENGTVTYEEVFDD